jgi:hypothetical protein
MRELTYDQWMELGYHVKRGERSLNRDESTGKPLFTRGQVEESPSFDLRLSNDERESLGIGRRRR